MIAAAALISSLLVTAVNIRMALRARRDKRDAKACVDDALTLLDMAAAKEKVAAELYAAQTLSLAAGRASLTLDVKRAREGRDRSN